MNHSCYSMINISEKLNTKRTAMAKGDIFLDTNTFELIAHKKLSKGDAISLAEIAGIMAAKRTADTIPLCHPLILDSIEMHFLLNANSNSITAYSFIQCFAKTGAEIEALFAVQTALLCIYDLAKAHTTDLKISEIEVIYKDGGKNNYNNLLEKIPEKFLKYITKNNINNSLFKNINFVIGTISDRASKKIYEDLSGNYLNKFINENGGNVCATFIIPDESKQIEQNITKYSNEKQYIIITTGGTGFSKRDITPDTLENICTREHYGIGEYFRKYGSQFTHLSYFSRSAVYEVDKSIVICLPGSLKAVQELSQPLAEIVPHIYSLIKGEFHDKL